MRKLREDEEKKKPRVIKLTDEKWEKFASLKSREKTWEAFIDDLVDIIGKIKNLGD